MSRQETLIMFKLIMELLFGIYRKKHEVDDFYLKLHQDYRNFMADKYNS